MSRALTGARSGDDEAFRQVWRTLQPPLLRYLRIRLRQDLVGLEADDVAAETWLQAIRDLPRFEGDATDFRRWLFTIARHRAIDAARSAARRPTTPLTELQGGLNAPSAEEESMLNAELDRALSVVADLPQDQAEAVTLRVMAGLDVSSVATLLGKSPGAVRVATHRGLRALAQHPRLAALRAARTGQ